MKRELSTLLIVKPDVFQLIVCYKIYFMSPLIYITVKLLVNTFDKSKLLRKLFLENRRFYNIIVDITKATDFFQ